MKGFLPDIVNRRKARAVIAWLSALLVLVFYLANFGMLRYGMGQLKGQLTVFNKMQPIAGLKAAGSLTDSTLVKLQFIDSVKQYAYNELGYGETDSYSYYLDLEGEPVLWLVSASERFRFEPYEWDYPVLGKMAYKGFFNRSGMQHEVENLKKKNLDVCEGEVQAWSTLGILPDPVLSSMLNLPKGKLARLILHEMTHGEIFIREDEDLNENLATFIGDRASLDFLRQQYGAGAKVFVQHRSYLADLDTVASYILSTYRKLDSLYSSFTSGMGESKKAELKAKYLQGFKSGFSTLNLANPEAFQWFDENGRLPKNCFFNDVRMYRKKQADFEEEFVKRFNRDLEAFVNRYKLEYGNEFKFWE